jgi:hypothetical protein
LKKIGSRERKEKAQVTSLKDHVTEVVEIG